MGRDATLALQLQVGSGAWVDVGYLYHATNRNWFEFQDSYWARGQAGNVILKFQDARPGFSGVPKRRWRA